MKRSFNYTDRAKLLQRSVSTRLYNAEDGTQMFDADIDLSDQNGLPIGTKIYLEAYYRNALMRFEVGSFDPSTPLYTLRGVRLDELQDPIVNFRIKLVDTSKQIGRLLGTIERIQVFNETNKQIERIGLLPVNFAADLGERIWDVEFSDDGSDPMLCINQKINVDADIIREFVARNPAFIALVFPEALRRILEQLVKEGVDASDKDSWQVKWERFVVSFGIGATPDGQDQYETNTWVTQAVEAFCHHTQIKTRFEEFLGENA